MSAPHDTRQEVEEAEIRAKFLYPGGFAASLAVERAKVRALEEENARLTKLLTASEDWRNAYRDGKYKLYAMGDAICEAAGEHLPCGEGPLDRQVAKVVGRPQLRSEVMQIAQLEAQIQDMQLATLRASQRTGDDGWNEAIEAAAVWAETHDFPLDIKHFMGTKKAFGAALCIEVARSIREELKRPIPAPSETGGAA